jgi:hypothetical protein
MEAERTVGKNVAPTQRHEVLARLVRRGLLQHGVYRWSRISRSLTLCRLQQTVQDAQAMHQQSHPQFLRSDNGGKFTATSVMLRLHDQSVGPSFIQLGHP